MLLSDSARGAAGDGASGDDDTVAAPKPVDAPADLNRHAGTLPEEVGLLLVWIESNPMCSDQWAASTAGMNFLSMISATVQGQSTRKVSRGRSVSRLANSTALQ